MGNSKNKARNWEEIFDAYQKATFADMLTYCEEMGGEDYEKFVAMAESGKNFVSIKKTFYETFFPHKLGVKKKKKTQMERLLEKSRAKMAAK